MSAFGKNGCREKAIQLDIFLIKMKVTIGLFFFKKVAIEREERENDDVECCIEKELKEWCNEKGLKIFVKQVEYSRFIRAHSVYQLHYTRHCKLISFSR